MSILLDVDTLVLVLVVVALFLKYAPYGKQGLQALSDAACAIFLPQAFLSYAIDSVFDVKLLQGIGDSARSLSGIAVGILTRLNLGVAPVFAVIVGLVLHDFKLLPTFIAAYDIAFLIKWIERRVPEGLDLIMVILFAPAVAFGLASIITSGVLAALEQIGSTATMVGDDNPYALAAVLGLVTPVIGMTLLSSMALTSLLGLTGVPMAIGVLTCTGSSFANLVLFRKLNIGGPSRAFAVCIEPLTQIDLIVQHPVQLYGTNALIGVVSACIVAFSGSVIGAEGTATPTAGAIVLSDFNNAMTLTVTVVAVITVSIVLAYITGTLINKLNLMNINFKVSSKENRTKESV